MNTTLRNAVNNTGVISASAIISDGGVIRLEAVNGGISSTGSIHADAAANGDGGDIRLIADHGLNLNGNVTARGGNQSGDGGFFETSARGGLNLQTNADLRAANGLTGTWLIDPDSITISSAADPDLGDDNDFMTPAALAGMLTGAQIFLEADSFITFAEAFNTNNGGTLTLRAPTLTVDAAITANNLILEFGDANAASSLLTTNTDINATVQAQTIRFDSTTVDLGANLTAQGGSVFFDTISNLNISDNITITAQNGNFSLNGANLAGVGANNSLTIDTTDGNLELRNISMSSGAGLDSLTLTRDTTGGSADSIRLSGTFHTDSFIINNTNAASEQLVFLPADTTINADTIQFTNTQIQGSALTLNGGGNGTSIELDSIVNIESLDVNGSDTLTLNGGISSNTDGITIDLNSGGTVRLNDTDITLRALNAGNIIINSAIDVTNAANENNLSINLNDGQLTLSTINNIDDLTLSNDSSRTTLTGDINISGDLRSGLTPEISIDAANADADIIITAASIDLSETEVVAAESDSNVLYSFATTNGELSLGDVTNAEGRVSATTAGGNLSLNGDITSSRTIASSLDLSAVQGIEVERDSVLTGNLNLTANGNTVAINNAAGTANSLEIVMGTQDFTLGDVGFTRALQSFSLEGDGALTFASAADANGRPIPQTSGTGGISFLGSLTLELAAGLTINTADTNGNINLSGLIIDGAQAITLTAGSGDISLGTLGQTTSIAALTTNTTGNINLHGNIRTDANLFDFSNASAVTINSDLSFGSEETPLDSLLFGDATIDGTFILNIYAVEFSSGNIGQNVALQDLLINTTGNPLSLSQNITVAGTLNLIATTTDITGILTSSGSDITIVSAEALTMGRDAQLVSSTGNINLTATTGDINLGALTAGNQVSVTASAGSILNAINDYQSNLVTSVNITAEDVRLSAPTLHVGDSADNPIVIRAGEAGINVNAGGRVNIANLNNASITSNVAIVDNAQQSSIAVTDAIQQLNLPTVVLSDNNMPVSVSDPVWENKEDDLIPETLTATPRIYYSKKGWRLGNPDSDKEQSGN